MNTKIYPFRLPQTIIAGVGAVQTSLVDQVRRFTPQKVLVVSDENLLTAGLVKEVQTLLNIGGITSDIYTNVEAEPSIQNLETSVAFVKEGGFELLIALGGGSVMDTTKLMAVLPYTDGPIVDYIGIDKIRNTGIPTIMLPTTSGTGAEVTINAVFTDRKRKLKKVAVSPYLMPSVAIVDPELTLSVPPSVTAATGMDALTHAIEAFVALKASPHSDMYAEKAIRYIGDYLRNAVSNGQDIEARYYMSLGSLFGGIANAVASVGAVHALSYPLGGEYKMPHGVANALMLPYVLEFNFLGNLKKFSNLAALLGEQTEGLSLRSKAQRAVQAVKELAEDVGVPLRLRDFGVPKDVLPTWSETVIDTQERLLSNNPRKLTTQDVLTIYENAW